MLYLMIISGVLAAAIGLAIKLFLDSSAPPHLSDAPRITWLEYAVGAIVGCLIITPLVVFYGYSWAQSSERVYNQYLNGWETGTVAQTVKCTRDGPCNWCYDCDPYLVTVTYTCNCDEKGNCSVCTRLETRYHSCPYTTTETHYSITTTLGDYSIARYRLPANPNSHRWRAHKAVPDSVIQRAGTGEPAIWAAAKKRVDSGYPGPVTKRGTYENFILASDRTILLQYTKKIAAFREIGMLPDLRSTIQEPYSANKVYFVGYSPVNAELWRSELAYFNAALGHNLQGDLHLVIVGFSVQNPEEYAIALRAYWQDTKKFGRDALSKNAIVLILGAQNGKVAWSRAFTGMPLGNESMVTFLQHRLVGADLIPGVIIGMTRRNMKTGRPVLETAGGWIENILPGKSVQFKRVRMGAHGDTDIGFTYLARETPVPTGKAVLICFMVLFFSGILWLACAMLPLLDWRV